MIDPRADVDPRAEVAADAEIGPWVRIGPGVTIGARSRVDAHSVVEGPTVIGADNHIHAFCAIGTAPQDKKFDPQAGQSLLQIGNGNTFREYCSINRGTHGGGGATTIGDDNWVMAYCHIAHDCHIGNHTVFANNSTLAGHVEIQDHVILGGFTGVHQFCRLGEGCFTAIAAIVVRDVPPFVIVNGNTARPRTINSVGLRRRGVDADTIARLKRCFRALYRQGNRLEQALEIIADEARECPHAAAMLKFISASPRGIVR
ncbi:MAG: acyl-ACP--UDP-N-acetylglucosamine O-acyltransferase [Gammaproteobacteria bacterium]|nr:acyl-ACP--UDP-N-acetylglucosamine O-acyltransferase [Gammaproteobacteria bacterium]MCP5202020.1 acyl-ACP--UDP-N-acetylglucosamine O-acyltransferase [Gammaproteobacteria bacterium]